MADGSDNPALRLGQRLRKAREEAGLSQHEVAARAGVAVGTVKAVERGSGTVQSLNQLAAALDLILVAQHAPSDQVVDGLVALRKELGISARTLATRLGIGRTTLQRLESKADTRIHTLALYSAAVGAGLKLIPVNRPKSFYASQGNASGYHGWHTPPALFAAVEAVLGPFDLDPCAPEQGETAVRARMCFTAKMNGLAQDWCGRVFMNPPYGRAIRGWVEKARDEAQAGAQVVGLVPARTETGWWHDTIVGHADVVFLRGRLAFGDGRQAAPFPSALVLWGFGAVALNALAAATGGNAVSLR